MAFCLPKFESEKMLTALRSGEIVPEKIMDMTSGERRSFFEEIVGKENAPEVNALFESKMLLKDQKRGLVSWAKQITGIKEATRKDIISTIERMEKVLTPESERAFLNDLAAKKLGTEVTFEEATTVTRMSKEAMEAREALPEGSPLRSQERMDYGVKAVKLQEYINELKGGKPIGKIELVAGTAKSLVSSLDNSFQFRQGLKLLLTHPSKWLPAFLKSWGVIKESLAGRDPLVLIRADIMSRPNALNGKYQAGKYDLGVIVEEAFPSSLPERIPLLGRLYKASENAFVATALRMRADYADQLIAKGEEYGLNMKDPKDAVGLGRIANAITGRGYVGLTEAQARGTNVLFFSIRYFKSNWQTLTAHIFDPAVRKNPVARREAATNLVKIIGTTATILWIAKQSGLDVEFDPRSSKFGKVCRGERCFDVTGGMGGVVTLAARMVPTEHNGKWGWWSKSAGTGKYRQLGTGEYGSQDALDYLWGFGLGKLSPAAGFVRDVWRQEDYKGDKIDYKKAALNLITPISVQQAREIYPETTTPEFMASMILESLGFGITDYDK